MEQAQTFIYKIYQELSIIQSTWKRGKVVNGDTNHFKNNASIHLLLKLLSACFENGIQPNILGKGTINLIPKSGKNNPRNPLNNRSIILSGRNWGSFGRAKWIPLGSEHRRTYFLINNSVQKSSYECKQTLCCFLDIQKAFDCIVLICFCTRLLEIDVTGKLFNAITSCYEHSCITRLSQWQRYRS